MGQENPEPGSGVKGREKARDEKEEKASGCQELEAGFNPQPGCPETSAPARGEQHSFCAGPARECRGGGEACEAPSPHRPALVPPYKGDGGPWRGERMLERGELPYPTLCRAWRWLSTGLLSHVGLGWGCRCGTAWGSGPQLPRGGRGNRAQDPKQTLPGEQAGARPPGFALQQRNQTELEGFAV